MVILFCLHFVFFYKSCMRYFVFVCLFLWSDYFIIIISNNSKMKYFVFVGLFLWSDYFIIIVIINSKMKYFVFVGLFLWSDDFIIIIIINLKIRYCIVCGKLFVWNELKARRYEYYEKLSDCIYACLVFFMFLFLKYHICDSLLLLVCFFA